MSNKIKTSGTTTSPVATRNTNFKIGVNGFSDYGPTSITGFYNGITPPSGGYTIYVHKNSGGPSIHVANDDNQCIFFLKSFGATGSTINDVLTWSSGRTDLWVQTSEITDVDGPAVDSIRTQLSGSQLTAYDAASVGNWIKITSTQYNNIVSNISGATKKGNSDVQVNTRDSITSWANNWLSFGTTNNPTFQINTGEYVIAMITETWNQSNATSQLGYTTTFNGNSITNIGGTAGPSSGGQRDYFVRKSPTDVATETRYPVLYMTQSPNAVTNWNGFRSADNGSSWISLPNNQVAKIQIVTTSTKSW